MPTAAQRNREVQANLQTVTTNGQAWAWAQRVIAQASKGVEQFSAWSIDSSHRWAHEQLSQGIAAVELAARPFAGGDDTVPFASASWPDLRRSVAGLYSTIFAIEGVLGDETELGAWGDFLSTVGVEAIKAAPGIVKEAVKTGADIAKPAIDAATPLLWPLAIGLVALVVVAVVVIPRLKGAAANGL